MASKKKSTGQWLSNRDADISKKLNVLISLSLRQLIGDKEFGHKERAKKGLGRCRSGTWTTWDLIPRT